MCLLHDADEYGLLRWPLKDIASAAGASMVHMRELVEKGVLKGHDKAFDGACIYTPRSGRKDGEPVTLVPTQAGPVWFSSRMVRDEYVRTIRGEMSRFGAADSLPQSGTKAARKPAPKASPKPPFGDGSSSSSSSSSSTSSYEEGIKRALLDQPPREPDGDEPPDGGARAGPTMAAAVCVALRAAGVASCNPGNPTLAALLRSGATVDAFVAVAQSLQERGAPPGNPFAYILATVKGQMADAATVAMPSGSARPLNRQEALEQRNRAVADEWVREMEAREASHAAV